MPVYENVNTVATSTKLETHTLNNECVLVRETRTFADVAQEGFPMPRALDKPLVFEYTMTAAMLIKRVAGKPFQTGLPVIRSKKKTPDFMRLTVRTDDWLNRWRTGDFKDSRDSYVLGRDDVYTAIVDDGMSPDNLMVQDTEHNCFDRYGKRLATAVFFDYITGGVTSRDYRDMKAVAETLLARDDVRIVNEHSWSKKTRRATKVDNAIDSVPYYNADSYPGGEMIQFFWTPTQKVFDSVLTAQAENGRGREWTRDDFYQTAKIDLDLFGINQYRWTEEERDARSAAHRAAREDD